MIKRFIALFATCVITLSSYMSLAAENDMAGDLCPNANILTSIIDGMCWSCLLPIRLAGIGGDAPEGAASPTAFCMCTDRAGVPEWGLPMGFFQPTRIVSFSPTPYCMPSFGVRLADDNTRAGQGRTETAMDDTETSFFHYKYWVYPVMQMIEMFANADCTYDRATTLDLAYFSEADPLYQDDLLAFVMFPETVIFANPIATGICTADCAQTLAGSEVVENYFCAGCSGNMYPMTGNNQYSDDPIRGTSLLTTRLMATLHRRGQARLTMGNHMTQGSCEPEYAPMIPKTQYRTSMLYPSREASADPTGGGSVPVNDGCCHKLGDSVLKWGNGRLVPGREAFVYLMYSWNDCCLR